jgi:hypothetical protein
MSLKAKARIYATKDSSFWQQRIIKEELAALTFRKNWNN